MYTDESDDEKLCWYATSNFKYILALWSAPNDSFFSSHEDTSEKLLSDTSAIAYISK